MELLFNEFLFERISVLNEFLLNIMIYKNFYFTKFLKGWISMSSNCHFIEVSKHRIFIWCKFHFFGRNFVRNITLWIFKLTNYKLETIFENLTLMSLLWKIGWMKSKMKFNGNSAKHKFERIKICLKQNSANFLINEARTIDKVTIPG